MARRSRPMRGFVVRRTQPPVRRTAAALGAVAFAALALGATACGALAIGRLAIGRIAVRQARFGVLEVEELRVRRLRPMMDARDRRR